MLRVVRVFACLAVILVPALAVAQSTGAQPPRITLPTVVVEAQKEPADLQRLPVSVTAVGRDTIRNAGLVTISDAALYAPNVFFTEFTARKLSTARFRGIGSSPANPGVTTFIDGVPQLNTNTSSVGLVGVERIEFVRGPQSALFGRNTIGGLVNVVSERPSLTAWTGGVTVPLGNAGSRELQGSVSGPLGDRVGIGFSVGYSERDGFTDNLVTGNDLDRRSASFWKAQALFTPRADWEARVIVSGERARDGDYALNDLAALRRSPFQAARNFEGRTDRDVVSTTVLARHEGARVAVSTTTGIVNWKTQDVTDLDYTPFPAITRDNTEEAVQFTQEVRVASAAKAPVPVFGGAQLRWQSGVFVFTQNYTQDAINSFAPGLLSPFLPFPISQHSPQSELDDLGIGLYGQGMLTFNGSLDVTLGARLDHEQKSATLDTFFAPAIAPPTAVRAEENYSSVSPQVAVAYRVRDDRTIYASVGRGFKAGGFNPASPAGSESYGEERTWNVEGGVKTTLAEGRVTANAAVFRIDWDDQQLNLPNLTVPGQFYIANVGNATSSGIEIEVNARPREDLDIFGVLGYTRARFGEGAVSSGVSVAGNEVPNTPKGMASFGAQYNREVATGMTAYGRAEAVFYGSFKYDDLNRAGQEGYSLTNLRAGVRGRFAFGEVWVRNAFDTRYIPLAFAYGPFAPSGFVGEMGRPRTFGISGGFTF